MLLAYETPLGDVACLRLAAEGSGGELACDGGFGHDAVVTQASGLSVPPPTAQFFLGADAGPGAATLQVPLEFAQLPAGTTAEDCLTASFGEPWLAPFITAVVTSTKGARTFDTAGESFSCGADGGGWRTEDGPGMLVVGVPTFDARVPGGNLATSFALADVQEACKP